MQGALHVMQGRMEGGMQGGHAGGNAGVHAGGHTGSYAWDHGGDHAGGHLDTPVLKRCPTVAYCLLLVSVKPVSMHSMLHS